MIAEAFMADFFALLEWAKLIGQLTNTLFTSGGFGSRISCALKLTEEEYYFSLDCVFSSSS